MYYNLYRKIYLFIHVYILVNCSQVGVVTIPIPLLLNAVWFWQMLKGAVHLFGDTQKQKAPENGRE